jgi:hypothetical protein
MTSTTPTGSVRLRRLVPAALIASAVALGASTLTDPALASARVWDIAAYQRCLDNLILDGVPDSVVHTINCCLDSGGVWVGLEEGGCKARAPEIERPLPPRVAPSAETTAPFSR